MYHFSIINHSRIESALFTENDLYIWCNVGEEFVCLLPNCSPFVLCLPLDFLIPICDPHTNTIALNTFRRYSSIDLQKFTIHVIIIKLLLLIIAPRPRIKLLNDSFVVLIVCIYCVYVYFVLMHKCLGHSHRFGMLLCFWFVFNVNGHTSTSLRLTMYSMSYLLSSNCLIRS